MDDRDEPLKDEAARRSEWRGDEEDKARPEPGGGTLPASEDDDERAGSGSSDGPSSGGIGTIFPPD
jgi:hypothetical protein